jgi:hypothetical protein
MIALWRKRDEPGVRGADGEGRLMHITAAHLDTIEKALTLQENWDKALEAVKEVREGVASDALLKAARDAYQSDDIEIDDDAGTSPHDEGCWVSAWVHLRKPVKECDVCHGHGSIGPVGAEVPDGGLDYFSTHTCGNCAGEGEIRLEFGEEDDA